MSNVFSTTPVKRRSRNRFNLSFDHKFSCQMGALVPTLIQEAIPGDSFTISTENLIRFAPMIAPVMHKVNVSMHYFFVPNRITYNEWEDFISPDLAKMTPPAWPNIQIERNPPPATIGSVADYMGIPVTQMATQEAIVSALPFAAYSKIYNEYYRDQNLQEPLSLSSLESGSNGTTVDFPWINNPSLIPRRAWQHDYFTSNLPFAQKGPAVELPIGDVADIYYENDGPQALGAFRDINGDFAPSGDLSTLSPSGVAVGATPVDYDPRGTLKADLSEATATTINELRTAIRLQEFFELAARGGTRYIEQMQVHFNVRSSDKRLNRPEFLGGSVQPVIVSEVLQTSESADTPQANMAGHGISASAGKKIRYFAEEHGYIIGIMSITPTTAYFQGLPRHFSRQEWTDYAWPTFAHLGEQETLNKELFFSADGLNDETFGYLPRYSEYRYNPSMVSGEMRTSLNFWHFGRRFENRPNLNADFIECRPTNAPFAVIEENQNMWCHTYHKINCKRKLPRYGVPTL